MVTMATRRDPSKAARSIFGSSPQSDQNMTLRGGVGHEGKGRGMEGRSRAGHGGGRAGQDVEGRGGAYERHGIVHQ